MRYNKAIKYLLPIFFVLFIKTAKSEELTLNLQDDVMYVLVTEGEMPHDTIHFGHYNIIIHSNDSIKQNKRSRWIAIGADLLTGPLGGHRIYMGTKPWVPVVYALTLGGGMGILPVADLLVILLSKNFDQWCDNPKIIMWL